MANQFMLAQLLKEEGPTLPALNEPSLFYKRNHSCPNTLTRIPNQTFSGGQTYSKQVALLTP
jgi:hypothetical protein